MGQQDSSHSYEFLPYQGKSYLNFNYMINDPLVDWLKLYSKNTSFGLNLFNPNPRVGDSFINFLRNFCQFYEYQNLVYKTGTNHRFSSLMTELSFYCF